MKEKLEKWKNDVSNVITLSEKSAKEWKRQLSFSKFVTVA